jgi:hypothetical protein
VLCVFVRRFNFDCFPGVAVSEVEKREKKKLDLLRRSYTHANQVSVFLKEYGYRRGSGRACKILRCCMLIFTISNKGWEMS